jgi:hypothetical protein
VIRPWLHILLHVLVPGVAARLGFPKHWKSAWIIMLSTMLVDLDHLLAEPLYDPNRCSIGFHPLHTEYAIAVYLLMLFYKPLRIVAVGLLIHMLLDGADCYFM